MALGAPRKLDSRLYYQESQDLNGNLPSVRPGLESSKFIPYSFSLFDRGPGLPAENCNNRDNRDMATNREKRNRYERYSPIHLRRLSNQSITLLTSRSRLSVNNSSLDFVSDRDLTSV